MLTSEHTCMQHYAITANHCSAQNCAAMFTVLWGSPLGRMLHHSDENTGPHASACDGGICVHNTWPAKKFSLHLQYNICHLSRHTENTALSHECVRAHTAPLKKKKKNKKKKKKETACLPFLLIGLSWTTLG